MLVSHAPTVRCPLQVRSQHRFSTRPGNARKQPHQSDNPGTRTGRQTHRPSDPFRLRQILIETLRLITGWLNADPAALSPSFPAYIGHPAYGLDALRADLDRFIFILGGNDGEHPLRPDRQ